MTEASAQEHTQHPGRLTLLVPAATIMIAAYDQAVIGVVLDSLKPLWHLGSFQVATLTSIAVVGMILGGATAGLLGDRFGRSTLLVVDLALFFGATLASAFAPDYTFLVACRLLVGVGIGADYTIALVYLAETAPALRRGQWMAASLFGANFGMLAAYGAGALLLGYGEGWRYVLGLGALAALPVLWWRRSIPETAIFRRIEPLHIAALLRQSFSRQKLRHAARPMAAWFSYQVGDQGIALFLPVILAGVLSSSAAKGSAAALAVKAVTIPASLATVFLIDRWGRRRLQVGGFLLRAASFGLLAGIMLLELKPDPLVVAALLALGMAVGSAGPDKTTPIVPAEAPGHATRATGQGMAQSAGRLGGIVGLVGYSLLAGSYGAGAGLAWLAAFALLGGIVSIPMKETSGSSLEELR